MKKNILRGFFIITLLSVFFVVNISKSDDTMVGYSDSKFIYNNSELSTITFTISGGIQTGFSFKVYNNENQNMTYQLGSVDASTTNDSFQNKTCLSENENQIFGQYISGDKSSITIPAGGSGIRNLTAQFPNYYSGVYNGCITFYPTIVGGNTVNTLPRKGNFIDVNIIPVGTNLSFKSFASNRVGGLNNSGTIKIYNTSKVLQKTIDVGVNVNGTGEFFTDIVPGTYHIVFKGQSHLASYLSGVTLVGGPQILDFTTGTNLYGTQQKNLSQDDGYRYQTAGDLKNTNGVYDYMVNGNDISIITANGMFDNGIGVLDPRNLNGDVAINASDIAVIGINFEKTDPYYNNTFSR
ncbi:hypothetical protein K9M48_03460 [Candidatus Gracilibacteria bacterium]|nr:hypothetical protein [Candidatus Gracilibacteria bacterium]